MGGKPHPMTCHLIVGHELLGGGMFVRMKFACKETSGRGANREAWKDIPPRARCKACAALTEPLP